jgi:hypothetical protein
MKSTLSFRISGCLCIGFLSAQFALAQTASAPPQRPDGPPPGQEKLTTEQLAKVKSILAPYKADSLTRDDAKAIKRAFRDAGIRPGRGLGDALHNAGFSPQKLEALDPRPKDAPPPPDGDMPPPK